MLAIPLSTVLCAAMLLAGAGQVGTVEFQPSSPEASVPELFRLSGGSYTYQLERLLATPRYTVWRLRFPSPVQTPEPENNVVHGEYFEPVGFAGRRPAVVVLHILGSDFPLSRYMAARLADRGVAALFLMLPYYGERRPKDVAGASSRRFLSADIERSMRSMRQGVCDVRRAVSWLSRRAEVDPRRLGVAGISLGGIVSALAAAVDPEIREGVFLLAGGDLARILWDMPEASRFRVSWEASGRTLEDLRTLTRPFDPLTHASGLAGKRVLMIAGKVDEVVPPASTAALWEAAGRPPITWYDCGHYSAVGYLLPAIRQTVDFLAGEASQAPAAFSPE